MGTFSVMLELGDPQGQRFEAVEALVDTGSSYTMVPASLLQQLGVTPFDRWPFRLASDLRVERDVGRTWVRVLGRTEITIVVFELGTPRALLGAYALEGLRLGVDSVQRRLVPTEGLLMASAHI